MMNCVLKSWNCVIKMRVLADLPIDEEHPLVCELQNKRHLLFCAFSNRRCAQNCTLPLINDDGDEIERFRLFLQLEVPTEHYGLSKQVSKRMMNFA